MRRIIDDLFFTTKLVYLCRLAFFVFFDAAIMVWLFIYYPQKEVIWPIHFAIVIGFSLPVTFWEVLRLKTEGAKYFWDPWNYLDILLIVTSYSYYYLVIITLISPTKNLKVEWTTPKFVVF